MAEVIPFRNLTSDYQIVLKIATGGTPICPECSSLPPQLLNLMKNCWDGEEDQRPSAANAAMQLQKVLESI